MKSFLIYIYIYFFRESYKNRIYRSVRNTSLDDLKNDRIIEPELLLLSQFISKNDIVFDIGANIGHYTYAFEQLTKSEYIYSFEPIPQLFDNLTLLFPKINLSKIAFSDKGKEVAEFKIPIINNNEYATRGKLDIDLIEPQETNYNIIKVSCDTVDNFVKDNNMTKIDFIKIDVEGHEFEVIKGALNTIINFRPILLIEIEQRHHDFSINEVFKFLSEYYSRIEFYSFDKNKFCSIYDTKIETLQIYDNIKTTKYINNFWFIP